MYSNNQFYEEFLLFPRPRVGLGIEERLGGGPQLGDLHSPVSSQSSGRVALPSKDGPRHVWP